MGIEDSSGDAGAELAFVPPSQVYIYIHTRKVESEMMRDETCPGNCSIACHVGSGRVDRCW